MTGAILAAHLALGSPALDALPELDAPPALDPEHSYKYCWACLSEYRAYGDPAYLDEINRFKAAGLVPAWISTDAEG